LPGCAVFLSIRCPIFGDGGDGYLFGWGLSGVFKILHVTAGYRAKRHSVLNLDSISVSEYGMKCRLWVEAQEADREGVCGKAYHASPDLMVPDLLTKAASIDATHFIRSP